jgi:ATP-dependent RNA helicase DeaD
MSETDRTAGAEFIALGLHPRLVETLLALGYEEPTPIQRAAIPPLVAGRDLMGQAATGTGKTAAFTLPVLHRLDALGPGRPKPSALILVPTRELAVQVAEAVHRYGRLLEGSVLPLYGGQSFGQQVRALQRGVDVIVATPGRALDHLGRGTLSLAGLSTLVLDEADEMLNMGFAEDIQAILAATPPTRQTMLFSVSLPAPITAIARRHLTNPVEIKVARERTAAGAPPRVRQTAYIVDRHHKTAALGRVLDVEAPTSAIVFCRTRIEVDELAEALSARGYRAEALHGGMDQDERERVMGRLRAGAADLVVATDVAARGLDIEQLSHVFNFDVPSNPEAYVHRIGRVGRAGRAGIVVTLAEPREQRLLRNIEQSTRQKIGVERLPTIADLRVRRLEMTRAAVEGLLAEGDLDDMRVVVESLATEHDLMQVALAAVKLAHRAEHRTGEEAEEIPPPAPTHQRQGRGPARARDAAPRGTGPWPERGAERPRRERRPRQQADMVRLSVNVGRRAGVRPQDLVGAITGEAGVPGSVVGAIDIGDEVSIVEVAEEVAAEVLKRLRGTRIKRIKVTVAKA